MPEEEINAPDYNDRASIQYSPEEHLRAQRDGLSEQEKRKAEQADSYDSAPAHSDSEPAPESEPTPDAPAPAQGY